MFAKLKTVMLALAVALCVVPASAQAENLRTTADLPAGAISLKPSKGDNKTSMNQRRKKKSRIQGEYTSARTSKRRAAPARRAAASASPTIYAACFYYGPAEGLFTISTSEYDLQEVLIDDNATAENGGYYYEGNYVNFAPDGTVTVWDVNTWESSPQTYTTDVNTSKVTIDPVSGTIYALGYVNGAFSLATLNNSDYSLARNLGETSLIGIFFDLSGNLWGFDENGTLYSVNKDNGTLTEKAEFDIDCYFGAAATVDPESGLCYMASDGWECYLFEINLNTFECNELYEFADGEEFGTLFIIPETAAGGAPARGSDLSLNFVDGSLSGKVSFTAPTLDTEGAAGTGDLSYILTVNAQAQSAVVCQWGEAVEVDYTVDAAGQYLFSVAFSNAAGEGDAVSASQWIGPDAPRAVTNVKAVRSQNQTAITWDAVTASVHGGYFIPSEVKYRVSRMPEDVVIAQDLTATNYTDQLADGNNTEFHTYKVEAVWNDIVSESTESNRVLVGAVYFNGFDSREDMDRMTNIAVLNNYANAWVYTDYYHQGGEAQATNGETTSADTWMRTEPLALQGGRTYTLSLQAWDWVDGYDELLSVYFSDLDPVANTEYYRDLYSSTPVLDSYVVNWVFQDRNAYNPITCKFTPETDGNYFIAFKAHYVYPNTEFDHTNIFVDDITLTLDPLVPMPAAPTVTYSLNDYDVTLTITAPTKDTFGDDLSSLTKVVVTRSEGEVVTTYENVTPGQVIAHTETLPGNGVYHYSVEAYNENGHSDAATVTVPAVVASAPTAPLRLTAAETTNVGEVVLSWDVPQRDTNGNPLDASTLTYNIYKNGVSQPEVTGVSGTTHTYQAVAAGKQEFVSFYVTAVNAAGEGAKSNVTSAAPFGVPDQLPYSESFSNLEFDNLWNFDPTDAYEDAEWVIAAASTAPVAQPQDNDGGMLAFYGEMLNDKASVTSGKIDLTEASSPRLTLWYFAENSSEGQNELSVYVNAGNGYQKADQFSMRDEFKNGWSQRSISLNAYKGKVVSIRLEGNYFRTEHFLLVDNIKITDSDQPEERDVEAYLLNVPSVVYVGNEIVIDAYARNNYSETMANVKVSVYLDNNIIATSTLNPIAAGDVAGARLKVATDNTWVGTHNFHFVVDAGSLDTNQSNNTSKTKTVEIKQSTLPTVGSLGAVYSDDTQKSVTVDWTAPNFNAFAGTPYTENFESFTPFVNDPDCEWKFVDGDGKEPYVVRGIVYDGYNAPHAFVVYDDTELYTELNAKSGNKYIAAASAIQAQSDDWMISPALTGEAQTVSLFARAGQISPSYGPETFEVMASSTGDDVNDFTVVKGFSLTSEEWTEFSVELPAGTKYFAIRYTGNDTFMAFFDDITYAAASHPAANFEILGYNVYRDGVRLNKEPVSGLNHTDNSLTGTGHKYQVSVVYDRGESPLSDAVGIGETGVNDVTVGVAVRAVASGIEVASTDVVNVFVTTFDGRMVFTGTADGILFVPVQPGFYIVNAAGNSYKLIVE